MEECTPTKSVQKDPASSHIKPRLWSTACYTLYIIPTRSYIVNLYVDTVGLCQ